MSVALDIRYGRGGGRRAEAYTPALLDELRQARELHLEVHRSAPCDAKHAFPYCPWCHPGINDR